MLGPYWLSAVFNEEILTQRNHIILSYFKYFGLRELGKICFESIARVELITNVILVDNFIDVSMEINKNPLNNRS